MARIDAELGAAIAAPLGLQFSAPEPERLTLLDLVAAVAEFARSEAEVVSVIQHLLETGQVTLVGQFCGPHLLAN
jgi:hypothetical protein